MSDAGINAQAALEVVGCSGDFEIGAAISHNLARFLNDSLRGPARAFDVDEPLSVGNAGIDKYHLAEEIKRQKQ